jgi:integrase
MADAARKQITIRTVEKLAAGETAWDAKLPGFNARRRQEGTFYGLKYRVGRGRRARQRWYTIGRHGAPWTVETARIEAKRLLGIVADGGDPADRRDAAKAAITVAELCDRYLAAVPTLPTRRGAPKKASTLATDRGRIERHIKPLLGQHRVDTITPRDVERFLRDVAAGKTKADVKTKPRGRAIVEGGKGTAARTVGLLGGIFSFAVAEGCRADNPVRGVQRYGDRKMERFLNAAELARLGAALAAAERDRAEAAAKARAKGKPVSEIEAFDPAVAAIRLLLFTGARKSEILALRWEHVDFALGCLRLPDSKTGAKVVPLGAPALALLKSLPRVEGGAYVLPGERDGAHYVGLPKAWERIRDAAKLPGVRLHDLRHSFASIAAAGGDGLVMIGKLLGHADTKTTARYAHLAENPVKAAANRIAKTVAAALDGTRGKVVPMRRRAGAA